MAKRMDIRITGEDGDEVQTIRTETAARYEVQVLTVSASRVAGGEVQTVTIKLTGDTSSAQKELDLQASLAGSFQLGFDTTCGAVCQCKWCDVHAPETTASIDDFSEVGVGERSGAATWVW